MRDNGLQDLIFPERAQRAVPPPPARPRGRVLFLASTFPRWEGDSSAPFVLNLAQDLRALDTDSHRFFQGCHVISREPRYGKDNSRRDNGEYQQKEGSDPGRPGRGKTQGRAVRRGVALLSISTFGP